MEDNQYNDMENTIPVKEKGSIKKYNSIGTLPTDGG